MIIMRHLHLWLIWLLFGLLLLWQLFVVGPYISLTWRMYFFTVTCSRRCTWFLHQVLLLHQVWFVVYGVPFMDSNSPLVPGLSVSVLPCLLLGFNRVLITPPCFYTILLMDGPFFWFMLMTWSLRWWSFSYWLCQASPWTTVLNDWPRHSELFYGDWDYIHFI